MPSLADNVVLFILALLLFGPKKLPQLARELGKWVGEFRRASADFRLQMEDELRVAEQADKQKKIDTLVAANPAANPALIGEPTHPHMPTYEEAEALEAAAAAGTAASPATAATAATESMVETPTPAAALQPIATSGDFSIMPPATGLPVGRSSHSAAPSVTPAASVSSLIDSIPEASLPAAAAVTQPGPAQQEPAQQEAVQHG